MELPVLEAAWEVGMAKLAFKFEVRLVITGELLDPDLITQQVGLQPSKAYRKGDPVSWADKVQPRFRARAIYKHGSWQLASRVEPQSELEDHVRDLMAQVRPCWDAMRAAIQQHDGDLDCAAYGYEYVPALWLPAELLSEIGGLGLSLGISVYDSTKSRSADETGD